MAFDFGAALTSLGTIKPEMDAARQQALLQLQQKQQFAANQKTQGLQQQQQQSTLDTEAEKRKEWVKQRDYETSTGEKHSIYLTPQGYQDVVDSPARKTFQQYMDEAAAVFGGKDKIPTWYQTQAAALSQGMSGTAANQSASLAQRTAYEDAQSDLRSKALALQEAKFKAQQDPKSEPNRLAAARAQAEFEKAQAYALNAQGRNLGTYNGTPIPGAMLTDSGQTVGSGFATNVRPTGTERQRADLAGSSLEQMGDMKDILNRRTDEFGPGAGSLTDFETWWGSEDEDAARLRSAAVTVAGHLAGVFGGTSDAKLADIKSVIGKNRQNPAAAIAGIEQMEKAAKNIQKKGTVHTVGGNNSSPSGAIKIVRDAQGRITGIE